MSTSNIIEQLHLCFRQLEEALADTDHQLAELAPLRAEVFELPDIEKGQEHDAIQRISVLPVSGEAAFNLGRQHFRRLFLHHHAQNISTKAAVRLPGVLCYWATPAQRQALQHTLARVNAHKQRLEQIIAVESGLPPEQRFEFVHRQLKGLLTLSAYRSLTLLNAPDSIHFGWANKQVINKLTRAEMLSRLDKSLRAGRAVPPYTREQWTQRLLAERDLLLALPEDVGLKIRRPVKVQPIARAWYSASQKQVQHPCSMPLIAVYEAPASCPRIGTLADYDADNIAVRHRPRARPLIPLIPRLHLYREADTETH
ncbi:DNA replication terminus site-binding protein [Edwardsiella hoshinae]|uniref:DNA replication terminus site-binding protein n=1 Tax=Edwardsiella hoshinae TaxID=93378 RepID=A0A376DEN4_9GAMM|nr:DNA replication terminus site-binding protein [Edwardsiella hoshinae]AOV96937.1 DNA replication terminus site-binding protein [Edwardsiella hoshinae]QPR27206.1 DNA replication terminus site-binding protein [Edwardsiella hoshinae]STC88143.1 DNA replication terminus site-binding protein [Edwardsiella hoshinae]